MLYQNKSDKFETLTIVIRNGVFYGFTNDTIYSYIIIIFFIIPLLAFIIKSAVKQGILEAYKIIKNDKDKNIL